jgi:DNA-binding NarL/FixJ family response regulator
VRIDGRFLATGERVGGMDSSSCPGDLARRLVGASGGGGDVRPAEAEGGPPEALTPRQREVLELLAQGLSNREIAARLHLSEGTVKNVVSEIFARTTGAA